MTDPTVPRGTERHLGRTGAPPALRVGLAARAVGPARSGGERALRVHYCSGSARAPRGAAAARAPGFDVVHHVSWGTVSAPPLVWRPRPLRLGAGRRRADGARGVFKRYFGAAWREEALRTFRVKLASRLRELRRPCRERPASLGQPRRPSP